MFDPTQPAEGSPLASAIMRSQLTSLKDLIDAILTLTAAQVDGTTTLNPGDPATAAVSVDGSTLRFTFGIPKGQDGQQGIQGYQGEPGTQGPPFAQALIDAVNTLNPGDPATVSVYFDGSNVHFTFGIPRGQDGQNGSNGNDGQPGPQGPPGEVTLAQLATSIVTTALNPSGVSGLTLTADPDYNQAQTQQLMDKLDELLAALKRP